jgi:hypothetical protein
MRQSCCLVGKGCVSFSLDRTGLKAGGLLLIWMLANVCANVENI